MFDKFSMENKYKAFLLVSLKSLDSSWIVETLYQASLFSNNNLSYIFGKRMLLFRRQNVYTVAIF